jgi:hypothetical protein
MHFGIGAAASKSASFSSSKFQSFEDDEGELAAVMRCARREQFQKRKIRETKSSRGFFPKIRADCRPPEPQLLEVLADQFGHFKHVDGFLAAKDGLQGCIGIDVAFVLRVLQLVLFDIRPELLGDFRAGKRLVADNRGKRW